jgi:hypothetical protein
MGYAARMRYSPYDTLAADTLAAAAVRANPATAVAVPEDISAGWAR